jgi:hypothetical protein
MLPELPPCFFCNFFRGWHEQPIKLAGYPDMILSKKTNLTLKIFNIFVLRFEQFFQALNFSLQYARRFSYGAHPIFRIRANKVIEMNL